MMLLLKYVVSLFHLFCIPVPNLNWWQEKLTETYQKSKTKLTFLEAFSESSNEDNLFKELSFEGKRGTITSYRDLFSIKDSSSKACKNILLTGRSGFGKTTLMNKLAYMWSNEVGTQKSEGNSNQSSKHALKRFKLVFLLNLEEIREGYDLCQAIEDQLVADVPQEMRDNLADTIMRLGSECLILFDGYDRVSNQSQNNILHILNSLYLKNCFTVVTCKSQYVQEIREKLKRGMECVQVLGFDDQTRLSYIQSYMNKFCYIDENQNSDTERSTEGLEETIKNSPVLKVLSRIPIFLSMMCLIWEKSKSVPENLAGLYGTAINILCRNCKESGLFQENVDVRVILIGLGRVALESLFEGKLWFDVDDVNSDILQKGRILGVVFCDTRKSGCQEGQRACFRFIHRTWQDFCAAFYWDSLKKKDFKMYLDKIDRNNVDEMELLLRFSCGLSSGAAAQMIITHVEALSSETINEQQRHMMLDDVTDDGASEGSLGFKGLQDAGSEGSNGLPSLGSSNDPWRLPILLLSDVESQEIEHLSEKQIDTLYNSIQSVFETLNINLSTQDQELFAVLNKENLKWPRFVKKVSVLWKHGHESLEQMTALTMKLMKSMTRMTSMEILIHPLYVKSYCSDLIRAMMETIHHLEHFYCQVSFDHTLMAQFLDQQKLKSLKLGSHRDIKFNCTYLFKKITRLQSLQELACSVPCDLRTLGIFLNRQSSLKKLSITPEESLDSTKFLKVVTKESKTGKNLEEIKLVNMSCENVESMGNFISQDVALQKLVLKHCTSKQSSSKSYQSGKSLCQSVHTVCFDNCSNNVVEAVIPAIGVVALTELRIENLQNMNESSSAKLFTKMKEVGKQKKGLPLKILSLKGTHVGKAVHDLVQVLSFTKHVTMLDMTNTGLPYRDIHGFFEQLWQIPSLEKLYLGGNKIGSGLQKTLHSLSKPCQGTESARTESKLV